MRCPAFLIVAAIYFVALASDGPAAEDTSVFARTLVNERAAFAGVNNLTYQKTYTYKTYDPGGKLKFHQTELYEVIFLNLSEYERLTSVDGKPLSRGQHKKEMERERQEDLRRKTEPVAPARLQNSPDAGAIYQFMPRDEGKHPRAELHPMIMPDLIPRLYLVTARGEETLGDRRVYVFRAVPKPNILVRGEAARAMVNLSLEIRIDVEDLRFAEIKATVTGDRLSWAEGSTIDLSWGRLDQLQFPMAAAEARNRKNAIGFGFIAQTVFIGADAVTGKGLPEGNGSDLSRPAPLRKRQRHRLRPD